SAGIALMVVFGLALYWPLQVKRLLSGGAGRWGYLALLLLGALLILVESWLGGQLLYMLWVGLGAANR
ncbi:MAG: hypothetical protein QG637_841, partial [Chloroflexota bacterium]|nr:hypothetical protein [Chloroflexota bacterium]